MEPAEAELEDQLSRLTGAARVAPLLRLAQLRSNRYIRLPTGSAEAGAVLEPGIANLREAGDLLPADDPGRPQVDNALGWLLSMRYTAHGGSTADRDSAIELLTGSVDTAKLAPVQQQAAYLILGQLSALRALHLDPNGSMDPMKQSMGWMTTGLSARSREDLDRAHRYLTRVVSAGPVNEQVRQAAEAMLQMVTMMRDMFGGMGQGNLMSNFNHLMGMMSRMGGGSAPSGFPTGAPAHSPLWTPTVVAPTIAPTIAPTVVEGTVIPKQAVPVPAAPVDGRADLRAELLRRLAGHVGTEPVDAAVVSAVLRPQTPPMPWNDADDAVATATAVHDSGRAADGVLLAVTLWLRARADDGGGWGGDPGASARADRVAGLEALVDAVSALRPDDALAAAARAGTAAFLADRPPLAGIPDALAERCVETGAGHPFGEVCRAGLALRHGRPLDPAAIRAAAARVPADDPWRVRVLDALGGALLVHSLSDLDTDAEPARRGLALIAAPDDPVVRLARALIDGTDEEVARSAATLPDAPAGVRAVVAEFAAGPETLAARAVGRLVALDAPADAFVVAASGVRAYLLRWVGEVFGLMGSAPVVPADVDALVCVHPVDGGDLCTLVLDRDGKVGVGGVGPFPEVQLPGRRRIVLLAPGDLGALPWAAVAGDDVVLWTVGSLARLHRDPGATPEIDADAVFVANPAGDRDQATVEAMVLRRMLYPTSTGLGRTVEQVDGPGTPDEVLAHLPGPGRGGASLLQLGCAVRTTAPGALGLAPSTGPAWLDLRRVTAQGCSRSGPAADASSGSAGGPAAGAAAGGPAGQVRGGLVVLPADAAGDPAGLLAVADTLLDAGMSGAVHWLRPVPPPVATLMLYRLHEYLVDDRMSPPDAVAAVRRWMRDENRPPPRCAPTAHQPPAEWWDAIALRT